MFFDWAIQPFDDQTTEYFIAFVLPFFINSIFIYGLFPIVCKKMRFVQEDESFATQFINLANLSEPTEHTPSASSIHIIDDSNLED